MQSICPLISSEKKKKKERKKERDKEKRKILNESHINGPYNHLAHRIMIIINLNKLIGPQFSSDAVLFQTWTE